MQTGGSQKWSLPLSSRTAGPATAGQAQRAANRAYIASAQSSLIRSMKRKLSKKEKLMRLLIAGSREVDSYSVPDVCRKIGLPYEQLLRWCKPDVAAKPDEAPGRRLESVDRARNDERWRQA